MKLRRDFVARKVHPAIESLVWSYHLGKPSQPLEVTGSMALDVHARLEEERRVFAQLDIRDLEQLAAESQALVDRAFQLAKIASNAPQDPQDVVVRENEENPPSEMLGKGAESYKRAYDNQTPSDEEDR